MNLENYDLELRVIATYEHLEDIKEQAADGFIPVLQNVIILRTPTGKSFSADVIIFAKISEPSSALDEINDVESV